MSDQPTLPGTEAAVVAQLARAAALQPQAVDIVRGTMDKAQVILVPQIGGSFKLQSVREELDSYREVPERRRGTAILGSLASFIAHTNRHKDEGTVVFADLGNAPSLLTVYDYNHAGEDGTATARHGQHRAAYRFPLSLEWQAWIRAAGVSMGIDVFAQFLEDRVREVVDPESKFAKHPRIVEFTTNLAGKLATAAKLLELSRGLAVRIDSKVLNAKNLANGTGQVIFAEEHNDEAGAPLAIPSGFAVAIPVFAPGAETGPDGQALQVLDAVPVQLRYRAGGGKITWSVHPYRLDLVLRAALTEAVERVRKETGLPVFEGSPES